MKSEMAVDDEEDEFHSLVSPSLELCSMSRSMTERTSTSKDDDAVMLCSTSRTPCSKDSLSNIDNGRGSTLTVVRNDDTTTAAVASTWKNDVSETIQIGIPIFIAMLSKTAMKVTDSSLLGHVSVQALVASSLSDLVTMCTGVFTTGSVLSVLCAAAIGAGNPKLAGVYLQVSLYILSIITMVVIVCWWYTADVLIVIFHRDAMISTMAGYYAKILALGLPGLLLLSQINQYFTAQYILNPERNVAMIAMLVNLLFGVLFVLGIPNTRFTGYGFVACPMVTTVAIYLQVFITWYWYIYKQRLHEPCWGGWNRAEVTKARVYTYLQLYVPAALGVASDFWRVAFVGAFTAQFGDTQVAVFSASYRIMWIVLVLVNAISTAASIKISTRLGRLDHVGAKQAAWTGIGMTCFILLCIGTVVLLKIEWFGLIFTNDMEFIVLLKSTRLPFTLTLVFMNLSVAMERIPYSMGRTREVFLGGFVASWCVQVPTVYLITTYARNDISGVYWGMTAGYTVLFVIYLAIVIQSDWKKYAQLAHQRSEV